MYSVAQSFVFGFLFMSLLMNFIYMIVAGKGMVQELIDSMKSDYLSGHTPASALRSRIEKDKFRSSTMVGESRITTSRPQIPTASSRNNLIGPDIPMPPHRRTPHKPVPIQRLPRTMRQIVEEVNTMNDLIDGATSLLEEMLKPEPEIDPLIAAIDEAAKINPCTYLELE